jgi:hypothetical protein
MKNSPFPFLSRTVSAIDHFAHKITQQRHKITAALLICSLGLTLYGTFGTYIMVQATANETYTVTNNIYFNATAMGKDGVRALHTFKLSVSQEASISNPDLPIKAYETVGNPFAPNVTIDLGTQIGVSQQVESFNTFGWEINENTTYFMAQRYIDGFAMMNTSMYYANFPHTNYAYPATEKQLQFDSPLHYVEAYCADNGYDLENIINSSYDETTDYNTLNGLSSELIKTCYGISAPLEEPTLAMKTLAQYGNGLNPEVKFVHWLAIGLAIIICAAAALTTIATVMLITGAQTAQHFADCNLEAVKYEIDAIYNWSSTLKATWDEEQAIAWAAYLAGNITLADYQVLCKMYTGQYAPLIANTTTDFQNALDAYYQAQQDLFAEYANAFGFSSSWSNILQYLLIFVVVIVAIFIVYTLFFRKKGTGAGGASGTNFIKM